MMPIPNPETYVPLMFQAQTKGRCQLQYIGSDDESDCDRWIREWTKEVYPNPPSFGSQIQTRTYQMGWRFVTNSGQDSSIIRPAIGGFGFPFYPGSSMKGAFRQACTETQRHHYRLADNIAEPSLLHFHGGYPINDWTEQLVDIVHPQQSWQVKTHDTQAKPKNESGFALVSLYQPTFQFGISSLSRETDWEEVWQIWEKAIGYGLGCRVSSGYGLPIARVAINQERYPVPLSSEVLCRFQLSGQGAASHSTTGIAEFRPNIFRGALRGHALRIFGGLTTLENAEQLVEEIFGGIQGSGTQGLLGVAFQTSKLVLGRFSNGYDEPTYQVKGELQWLLAPQQQLNATDKAALQKLMQMLTRFAMLLGGFGKSWRRADHRLFYEQYYTNQVKPLIGCHWSWQGKALELGRKVGRLSHIKPFLTEVQTAASDWMRSRRIIPNPNQVANWREAWHPENVQVWGRIADGKDDCKAILWFHQPYQRADRQFRTQEQGIKGTSLTGKVSQVGRTWHRMYPLIQVKTPNDPDGKKILHVTDRYLELLTIFPDDSNQSKQFLDFLATESRSDDEGTFQQLWGDRTSD